jgi:hypothetical protein
MNAIRQIIRIPKSHEIKIQLPKEIPENDIAEVILLIRKSSIPFHEKLDEMKKAANDPLFMADLQKVSEDFEAIDEEGWE